MTDRCKECDDISRWENAETYPDKHVHASTWGEVEAAIEADGLVWDMDGDTVVEVLPPDVEVLPPDEDYEPDEDRSWRKVSYSTGYGHRSHYHANEDDLASGFLIFDPSPTEEDVQAAISSIARAFRGL